MISTSGFLSPLDEENRENIARLEAIVAEKDAVLAHLREDFEAQYSIASKSDQPIRYHASALKSLVDEIDTALSSDGSKLLEVVQAAVSLNDSHGASFAGAKVRLANAIAAWQEEGRR